MNFNKHSNLEGLHSFLSPSKYHWLNYSDDELIRAYSTARAAERGTELHEFAKKCIELNVRLPDISQTLNMYVNDAIGYRMTPEQPLFYSINSFGTADAISCRDGLLRIHDLKTGVSRVSMHQLEIYAALFCLEYDVNPTDISFELRIYQNNEVLIDNPDADCIFHAMDRIVYFDKLIEELKSEEEAWTTTS